MPVRVRAQISCEQTQSCDGNGEMNASSAFERQQRKFERKKKEKKKKARKMVRNKKIISNLPPGSGMDGDFFYDRNKCVLKPK